MNHMNIRRVATLFQKSLNLNIPHSTTSSFVVSVVIWNTLINGSSQHKPQPEIVLQICNMSVVACCTSARFNIFSFPFAPTVLFLFSCYDSPFPPYPPSSSPLFFVNFVPTVIKSTPNETNGGSSDSLRSGVKTFRGREMRVNVLRVVGQEGREKREGKRAWRLISFFSFSDLCALWRCATILVTFLCHSRFLQLIG